jgi:hypothetical protein
MAVYTVFTVCIAMLVFTACQGVDPWRVLVHPFTCISVQYLIFFGERSTDRSMAETVDAWIAVSYVVFAIGFLVADRLVDGSLAERFWDAVWPSSFPANQRQELLFCKVAQLLPAIWFILFVYMRSIQYGSFEQAIVALYSTARVADTLWLGRIVSRLFVFGGAASAVALYLSLVQGYRGHLILCLALQGICILAAASTGCRGQILLFPFLDGFILVALRVRLGGWPSYTKLVIPVLVLGAALTGIVGEIRSTEFRSLSGVLSEYQSDEFAGMAVDGWTNTLRGGADRRIVDDVAFCFQNYRWGNTLGWHTLFSIVANPVPREIWLQKPVGFGAILAWDRGASQWSGVSLAAGLAGEGFAGGEFLGVIVMAAFVGLFAGVIGKLGYHALFHGRIVQVLVGLVAWRAAVMFVRGDVLSAWSTGIYPLALACLVAFSICRLGKGNSPEGALDAGPDVGDPRWVSGAVRSGQG